MNTVKFPLDSAQYAPSKNQINQWLLTSKLNHPIDKLLVHVFDGSEDSPYDQDTTTTIANSSHEKLSLTWQIPTSLTLRLITLFQQWSDPNLPELENLQELFSKLLPYCSYPDLFTNHEEEDEDTSILNTIHFCTLVLLRTKGIGDMDIYQAFYDLWATIYLKVYTH